MGLENPTYISDLVDTNPTSGDPKSQGDDHLRGIKHAVKTTFPNVTGAVTPTHTELNYVDGVTSSIQTQLNTLDTDKADLDSPALTGIPTAPTAATGTSGAQLATLDYVNATATSASLPGQTGNAGKILTTDGTDAGWSDTIDTSVIDLGADGDIVGTLNTQILKAKTITDPIFADQADQTKTLAFNLTRLNPGVQRVVDILDEDTVLGTPYARLLMTVTASNSATVDIEHDFNNIYDLYVIEAYNVVPASNATELMIRFKKGGAYLTGTVYTQRVYTGSLDTGQASITALNGLSNSSGHEAYLQTTLVRPFVTDKATLVTFNGGHSNGTTNSSYAGTCTTTGAVKGVRFYMSAGNMISGTFKLFGVRRS